MQKAFLKAQWRKLAMVNYSVPPGILEKYLPNKTELDIWEGTCYVSLVGFMFLNTKIKGLHIPFHSDFEEVNLRFYVRSFDNAEWKRGVVFVKEIVPKPALTFIANSVYGENYETLKMGHRWDIQKDQQTIEYAWEKEGRRNSIMVNAETDLLEIKDGSEEEFITEHYWGYTKIGATKTSEYRVEHSKWNVYKLKSWQINVDFENTYGSDFAFLDKERPTSVFLAEGSEIIVRRGKVL